VPRETSNLHAIVRQSAIDGQLIARFHRAVRRRPAVSKSFRAAVRKRPMRRSPHKWGPGALQEISTEATLG
jgi:hypothetical protein